MNTAANDGILDPQRLHDLMLMIKVNYPFNGDKYPALKGVSNPSTVVAFAANHSLKHMSKSVGALAAQCEHWDHGGPMKIAELQVLAAKMIINSLNFANALSLNAEDVVALIRDEFKPPTA